MTDNFAAPTPEPDRVLRYADHADGIIDLFLPPQGVVLNRPRAATGPLRGTATNPRETVTNSCRGAPPDPRRAVATDLHPGVPTTPPRGAATNPPHSTPPPLVVAIHGGYWRAKYDRVHLRPLCRALADRGYAVALPEFRRTDGGGGEWPVIGADIEEALHYLATIPERDTPEPDSPAPEFDLRAPYRLIGHSAGGHLALWAGLRAGPARCQGILALAPVADLYEAAARHLSNDAAQTLLGGGPEQWPGRYSEANPATYLPSEVPITIIHGDADTDVPVDISRTFAAAHPEIDYREIPGADHFALIDPHDEVFRDAVVPAIDATTADSTGPAVPGKG